MYFSIFLFPFSLHLPPFIHLTHFLPDSIFSWTRNCMHFSFYCECHFHCLYIWKNDVFLKLGWEYEADSSEDHLNHLHRMVEGGKDLDPFLQSCFPAGWPPACPGCLALFLPMYRPQPHQLLAAKNISCSTPDYSQPDAYHKLKSCNRCWRHGFSTVLCE